MADPSFTIGIEEEYQFIDPDSRELLGYVTQSMARQRMEVQERYPDIKIAQYVGSGILEAGTPVCADIKVARQHLLEVRTSLLELAHAEGVKLMAAGTHPFSSWEEATIPTPRYRDLVTDAQIIARRMLAFGLNIQIGLEERDLAIDIMNTVRYVMPHLLALSTNSPFWTGKNTGLKSYRKVLLDALPRTGTPGRFDSYSEYQQYVETLIRTNSIPDASRLWFDVLPHYRFPTLAIRICDMITDVQDTLAITALIQATVAWMVELRERNMAFRIYERTLIDENRWRAVRYGLDGNMIDFGIEEEVPTSDLIKELLTLVEPSAARLNALDELAHIHTILQRGTGADHQIKAWNEADEELHAVVDYLIRETERIA